VHNETGSLKYAEKQFGHSNIATTGNIYTHIADDELDLVAEAIGRALSGFCGRPVVETVSEKEVV
jgi:integrase